LFLAHLTGLLLGRHFQSSCQQSTHGRHRDLFHLRKINVQPGAFLAPMLPHDDFSPALGQFFNALEIFRFQLSCSHVASLQRDMPICPSRFYPIGAGRSLSVAK
jgi:hypothetical protein